MKITQAQTALRALVPFLVLTAACSSNNSAADTTPSAQGGAGGTSQATGGASTAATGGASTAATGGKDGKSTGGVAATGGAKGTHTGGSSNGLDAGEEENNLLIDDFEDGDSEAIVSGGWYGYNDVDSDGKSELSFTGATGAAVVMGGAGYNSERSLEVSYTFDQGTYQYDPFIGFGVSIGTAAKPFDLSPYSGLSYAYKGGAHRVRVETSDVEDYDHFGVDLPASKDWTTVSLPFTNFAQEGWGASVDLNVAHTVALSFHAKGSTGQKGKLQIDNLKVVGTIVHGAPDMTIKPVSPPADGVLSAGTITNPLQAKATTYLSRGVNITNWLEQEDFKGFTYDEAYIEKLAHAGFKSLRLPIDLDRYIASSTGTGDTLAITLKDDLFTILDSFNTWTKAHGLSLTIDYHHYSSLLDYSRPDTIEAAVQLWAKVAEHFAAEPREDLFFELLNEPELSFVADGPPTPAQWTTLAERMIAAIRATDTTHSIIFGATEWYGIDALSSHKLLSDANVVYAFHDYDPFIFTHQGASWAKLGSTHGLPYPYNPERWSQYYSDLGFNSSMSSWLLDQADSYYTDGTHSAVRNHILEAKNWAIKNNVPVICNEFGAYDATSKLEDRVAYYKDVVGIYDELAIPWQIWFMVMDSTGVVAPEIASALKLGE